MNIKKAKAIRKFLKYKPSLERKYVAQEVFSYGSKSKLYTTTLVNDVESARGKYLTTKKLFCES